MALKEGWHLDKRVPVALIVTLIAYGVAFVYMFSELKTEVRINKQDISAIQDVQREMQRQAGVQSNQLSRIEEQIIGLRRDLSRYLESMQ